MPETYVISDGVEEQLNCITYAPLPWQTHPIDTVPTQSQGWGPFPAPWTPLDFQSAKDSMTGGFGLDITWDQGNNTAVVNYAPSYATLTLMQDRSVDFVNNSGFLGTILATGSGSNTTSTIANASDVQVSGIAPANANTVGFWASLKSMLSGGS